MLPQVFCVGQSIAKMISVTKGLGKAIHLVDPAKLLAVEKVAKTSPPHSLVCLVSIY